MEVVVGGKVTRLLWDAYSLETNEMEGIVEYLRKEVEFRECMKKVEEEVIEKYGNHKIYKLIKKIRKYETEDIKVILKNLEKELHSRRKKYLFYIGPMISLVEFPPYAAKITYANGEIQREFYELRKKYWDDVVMVHGKIHASVGEVVEIRFSRSKKYWFIVSSKKELTPYACYSDDERKNEVIEYLQGKITFEDLERKLEYNKIREVESIKGR